MQLVTNDSSYVVNVPQQDVDHRLIIESTALAIVALLSIFGNFIVSVSLVKRQRLVTPSNRLVLSLTASNFAFSVLVLPFIVITRIQQEWIFGVFWCHFNGFITMVVSVASTATLAMIAIDRYVAIVKPMLYSLKMTNSRAALMLLWIWLQAFVFSIPPFIGWSRYDYSFSKYSCFMQWRHFPYYSSIFICICFVVPIITMISCYYMIFQVARTKCRRISVGVLGQTLQEMTPTLISPSMPHHHSSPILSFKTQRKPSWMSQPDTVPVKGIWTICMIFGSFFISYSPHIAEICLQTFVPNIQIPTWFTFWSSVLFYSSSISYAFIYGLYNRSIRKEMKAFLFSKSSNIFQGLPAKCNMKRTSRTCSIIDFNAFKLKPHQSAPHLSQLTPIPSQNDIPAFFKKNEKVRKDSQDSGAVMTAGEMSDTEAEPSTAQATLLSHAFLPRRFSAPSSLLNNSDSNTHSCRKPKINNIAEIHQSSPINIQNSSEYVNTASCFSIIEDSDENCSNCTSTDNENIELRTKRRSLSEPVPSTESEAYFNGQSDLFKACDEGIENDCAI